MLVLLSSSARRRYRDDIVRALDYPVGTGFRFRYAEQHLDPDLAARHDRTRPTNLSGIVCYLAARDCADPLLLPCRFVTVTRIQRVGTSYVFMLRMSEFVKDLDDAKLRGVMTPGELTRLPRAASAANTPSGQFAFEICDSLVPFRAAAGEAMTAFEKTTVALRQLANFQAGQPTAFFSVQGLASAAGGPPLKPHDGRYELDSGRRYLLDVYSFSPEGDSNPSEAMTLSASADDSELKFSSETVAKLDSRYDLVQFAFSTEQRLFELPAGLRLTLGIPKRPNDKRFLQLPGSRRRALGISAKPDDKDLEQRCDILLDLRFRGSLRLSVARVAMIAIGTAMPAVIGAYAAGKGSLGLAGVMFIASLFTGVATVFPALKKA